LTRGTPPRGRDDEGGGHRRPSARRRSDQGPRSPVV